MRRINITVNNSTRITKSFINIVDLEDYLLTILNVKNLSQEIMGFICEEVAEKIWDSSVAEKVISEHFPNCFFSIQSKARVGNQLVL